MTRNRIEKEMRVCEILSQYLSDIRQNDPDRLVVISGEISQIFYDEECEDCIGSGREPCSWMNTTICISCNGTGKSK